MPNLKGYQLSLEADRDVEDIWDYTGAQFGFDQAEKYVSEFKTFFGRLIENPKLGKNRDELKPGLRSFAKAEHLIFYRIREDHIWIVRILHGSRDVRNYF